MSQAEDLLNSLTTDDVGIYSVSSETEPLIIVGTDRNISVPASLRRIAVKHDHNVETVTFECPRHWDEHDFSTMDIYINYELSNGYADSYPVRNLSVSGDSILFTWTISHNVTQVSGSITFLVCVKDVDDDGNEAIHWNSELCKDMYVSNGLETEAQIAEKYPDLIVGLKQNFDDIYEEGKKYVFAYATSINELYKYAQFPEGYEISLNLLAIKNIPSAFYEASGIKTVVLKGSPDYSDSVGLNCAYTFYKCPSIEVVDVSEYKFVPSNFDYTFYGATALREIKGVLYPTLLTSGTQALHYLPALEEIRIEANSIFIPAFDIPQSPLLSAESVRSIIDSLCEIGGNRGVLTLHSDVVARLTDDELKEIYNKNWTVG